MKKTTSYDQKNLPEELQTLWAEQGGLTDEVSAALSSIASEPAPDSLKQKILKQNFEKEAPATEPMKLRFLFSAPAALVALLIISLFSLSQMNKEYSTPEGSSSEVATATAVSEPELLVALFESDLDDDIIFDVFADGFLSLEETV